MPVADTRPAGFDLLLRPATTVTLSLTGWPTGSLTGRTFTSTLNGDPLDVAVDGDVITIVATDTQTGALTSGRPHPWQLLEDLDGTPEPIVIGTWVPDDGPRATSAATVQVTVGQALVDVTVASAQASIVALDARLDTVETDVAALDAADTALAERLDQAEAGTVNVLAYGAVGDGVADDTAAIQAAIDAAPPGGRVWFPPGIWLVSAPIRLRGGLTYMGPGHALSSVSVIRQAPGADMTGAAGLPGVLAAAAWATNADTCDEPIAVRGLTIDGNAAANPTSNAAGIIVVSYSSWVDDCYILDTPSHGIVLTDVTADGGVITNSASENRISRCRILDPGGNGIHQVSANTISNQDGYATDNVIAGGVDAIRFQRGSGWVFRRNHTYGGAAHGIYLENCYATVLAENEIEVFGEAAAPGEHYAGISITQLNGRGTHIIGNFVGCDEPSEAAGSYQYIAVTAGSGETDAQVIVSDNLLKGPAVGGTTKGRGIVLTGDVSGSMLHARVNGNRAAGMAQPSVIGSGVITYRQDRHTVEHPDIGATTGRFGGPALGTGAPPPGGTGSDLAGTITFGTGTGTASGEIGGVNYDIDFVVAPTVILTPGNAATAALSPYIAQSQTWGLVIGAEVAPDVDQPAGTYVLHYLVG